MKLTPRKKKILTMGFLIALTVGLAGCSVPTKNGKVVLITNSTTFRSIMKDENWFSAIFVWPLAWCINHMAPVIGVGGAIAIVTIVVNGILALVTLKSTIATQQMQMIQPELEKIQRKYEGRDDDASKMRQANEMNALYKKYNINPAATMIITFIQLPIIMAMYMAVQRAEAVQHGKFLGMDLAITPWNGMKGIFQGNGVGWAYLFLFLFMAACQILSMKIPQIIQKRNAEKVAEKQHRRPQDTTSATGKYMQWYMIAMVLVFGLMWPSAMALYWAINSLVNVVKTIIIQSIIEKRKAVA